MMRRLLSDQALRARLRAYRPLYDRIFRRQKDLSRLPAPTAALADMEGRGVFMFAFGRCGTTVFGEFLMTHPQVVTYGEVLNQDSYHSFFQDLSRRALRRWPLSPALMRAEFYPFLQRLVRRAGGASCLFDLKIETLHLIEGNYRIPGPRFELFELLRQTAAPVILVERRDLVARHISGRIAARRGAYHSYHAAAGAEIAPFEIDIARMEEMNAAIRAQTALIRRLFADHPRFEVVVFEDMFETDPQTGQSVIAADLAARMARLLGLENRFDRRPKLQRMSRPDQMRLIRNAEAVEAARARQPGPTAGP